MGFPFWRTGSQGFFFFFSTGGIIPPFISDYRITNDEENRITNDGDYRVTNGE